MFTQSLALGPELKNRGSCSSLARPHATGALNHSWAEAVSGFTAKDARFASAAYCRGHQSRLSGVERPEPTMG
jgi:hypothetical protein